MRWGTFSYMGKSRNCICYLSPWNPETEMPVSSYSELWLPPQKLLRLGPHWPTSFCSEVCDGKVATSIQWQSLHGLFCGKKTQVGHSILQALEVVQIQQTKLNPTTIPLTRGITVEILPRAIFWAFFFFVLRREGCLATQWMLLFREPNDSVEVCKYDFTTGSNTVFGQPPLWVKLSRPAVALGGAVQDAKAYRRNLKISWNSANRPQKFGVGRRPAIVNTVLGDIPHKQFGSFQCFGWNVYRTLRRMDTEWWERQKILVNYFGIHVHCVNGCYWKVFTVRRGLYAVKIFKRARVSDPNGINRTAKWHSRGCSKLLFVSGAGAGKRPPPASQR